MGAYIPRIESPLTGEPEPAPTTGSMCKQDEENIRRFKGWFKVANREQLVSFWAICIASIVVFSVLAYSTVYGKNISDEADFDFIQAEGEVLKDVVAPVVRDLLLDLRHDLARCSSPWASSTTSSRLSRGRAQDPAPARERALERVQDLHRVRVGMCLLGIAVLASGFDQPLVLLVLSACLNGIVMFIYSILLIKLNRGGLPPAIRVSRPAPRRAVLLRAVLRLLRRLVRDHADRGAVLDAGSPGLRAFCSVRRDVHRPVRGGGSAGPVVT